MSYQLNIFSIISLYVYYQILKEFELMTDSTIASSFSTKWPELSKKLRIILTQTYQQKRFCTDWSLEIENILILLKLFPSCQIGRNIVASSTNFKRSTEKLIKYETVRF